MLRERRDQHAILRAEKLRQPPGGVFHEVESPRHALAAVDEQREDRRDALVIHQVERLRDAVFLQREVGRA